MTRLADLDHRAADVDAQHLTVGETRVFTIDHGCERAHHQQVGPREERCDGRDVGRTSADILTAGEGRSTHRRALVRERRATFERVLFAKRNESPLEFPSNARAHAAARGSTASTARRKLRRSVGPRSLSLCASRGTLLRRRDVARVATNAVSPSAWLETARAVGCTRGYACRWVSRFFDMRPACSASGGHRSHHES